MAPTNTNALAQMIQQLQQSGMQQSMAGQKAPVSQLQQGGTAAQDTGTGGLAALIQSLQSPQSPLSQLTQPQPQTLGINQPIPMSMPQADPTGQAAPDIGSSVYLECRPPLDRKDRNPVVKTFVNLSFKNGHEVQEFSVIHELFDGRKIDRSNQYTGTVTHVPGQNEWSWSGRLDSNRRITMEARVFRNARNEWWYEENVFDNGRSDGAIQYRCNESEGGD